MGIVNPIPLRAAEKVLQRTYYVARRAVSGSMGFLHVEEALAQQAVDLTVGALQGRGLRYNQPVSEAVDSIILLTTEKPGWW